MDPGHSLDWSGVQAVFPKLGLEVLVPQPLGRILSSHQAGGGVCSLAPDRLERVSLDTGGEVLGNSEGFAWKYEDGV